MSIVFPSCNISAVGGIASAGGAVGLLLPAGASFKAANTGFVTGLFFRGPKGGDTHIQNFVHNLLSRQGGVAGGNDAFIYNANQAGTSLTFNYRSGGTIYANLTISGLVASSTYLVLVICTAANVHFVACKSGEAPIVATSASSALYALNLAAADVWSQIGAGTAVSSRGAYLPIENYFHLHGLFPESAGVPDAPLIQEIASGAQSISTLAARLTSGVNKWHYPLNISGAHSDAFAVASELTTNNVTINKVIMTGGPLLATILTPTDVHPSVSQVQFGTPGNAATAFTKIIAEGGTFTGVPAAIQTRLRKEDGTDLVGWTVCDASPSAGTFDSYTFLNVPMTAGNLNHEYRQVDSGGAQIGSIVGSYGTKGAGFNQLQHGQSQSTHPYQFATLVVAPPETMRARFTWVQTDTPLVFRSVQPDPAQSNAVTGAGIRQAAIEINTLFPGVPVHFANLGIAGTTINEHITAGARVGNWASYAAYIGVTQPYVFAPMGHSSSADASYQTYLSDLVALATSNIGLQLKNLHAPVPRYAGSGTGAVYSQVSFSRSGARSRVAANPTTDWIAGNWQGIKCDTNDTGPHPMQATRGVGRTGAFVAWALMAWCRAVEDVPLKIVATRASPTKVQLRMIAANQ